MRINFICTGCFFLVDDAVVDDEEVEEGRLRTRNWCWFCASETDWLETSDSYDTRKDWTTIEIP